MWWICAIVVRGNFLMIPKQQFTTLFTYNILQSLEEDHDISVMEKVDDMYIFKTDVIKPWYHDMFEIETIQIYETMEMGQMPLFNPPSINSPWYLERISNHNLENHEEFSLTQPHSCITRDNLIVNTYIIDTGIDIHHHEFEGRAKWGFNASGDHLNKDMNGHGTHVAGLVGSKSYGVCKDAHLIAVKVLGKDGSGSTSGVIQGINWALKDHLRQQKLKSNSGKIVKSLINMSLGGGKSRILNKVLTKCSELGMFIGVAAGNESQDSCNVSPASADKIFTIMASDKHDDRAWFSNYGDCADLYSPGVDIISTFPNNQHRSLSGTSFSSPLFVGVMHHYLDMYDLEFEDLKKQILEDSSKGVIKDYFYGSKTDLIYLHR